MIDKKLSNFRKMTIEKRRKYLDFLVSLKHMEECCKDMREQMMDKNLPTYEDISKHNKTYGMDNSKYLN